MAALIEARNVPGILERGLDDRSSDELLTVEAEKRGLQGQLHVRLDNHEQCCFSFLVHQHLGHTLPTALESRRMLSELFAELQVEHAQFSWVTTRESGAYDGRKVGVWQLAPRYEYLHGVCLDLQAHYRGMPLRVWHFCRHARTSDEDLVYTFLSAHPEGFEYVQDLLEKVNHWQRTHERLDTLASQMGSSDVSLTEGRARAWDNLVLTPEVERATRRDLEWWVRSEARYTKLGIGYRRGYLFEGPPGNGKTAVIRAMLSSYPFYQPEIDLSDPRMTDAVVAQQFDRAHEAAPAAIVLEDIDRLCERIQQGGTYITLSGLLNALDGVHQRQGVIVIASANNPEKLDAAIRRRPGRFDVPVHFPNPDERQRTRYLRFLLERGEQAESLSEGALERQVARMEGMSMAFVRSVYEQAAMRAAERSEPVMQDEDLGRATTSILSYYREMEVASERSAGFAPRPLEQEERPPGVLWKRGECEGSPEPPGRLGLTGTTSV